MDTDVSVSVTWTGPRTIPGNWYSVEASGSGGTYTGRFTISPLAEGQNDGMEASGSGGTYTGSLTISPLAEGQDDGMEASGSGETYTGSLTISPLAEGHNDGQYTCSVTVSGGSSVLEATNNDSTTIDVMGKDSIVH